MLGLGQVRISMGSRAQFGYLGLWGGPPNSRKLAEFTFLWDRGLNLGIWGLGGAPEQSQVSRIHISMGWRAQFGYLGLWGGPPNSRKLAEFIFLWDRGLNLGIWGLGGGPRTVAS